MDSTGGGDGNADGTQAADPAPKKTRGRKPKVTDKKATDDTNKDANGSLATNDEDAADNTDAPTKPAKVKGGRKPKATKIKDKLAEDVTTNGEDAGPVIEAKSDETPAKSKTNTGRKRKTPAPAQRDDNAKADGEPEANSDEAQPKKRKVAKKTVVEVKKESEDENVDLMAAGEKEKSVGADKVDCGDAEVAGKNTAAVLKRTKKRTQAKKGFNAANAKKPGMTAAASDTSNHKDHDDGDDDHHKNGQDVNKGTPVEEVA